MLLLESSTKHVKDAVKIEMRIGTHVDAYARIIILLPLLWIAQHSIRLLYLLKPLFVTALIWMMLAGQTPICAFDVIIRGPAFYA